MKIYAENDRLWEGIFNWYTQNIKLYTHAPNEKRAKQNLLTKLSYEVNKSRAAVITYYRSNPTSYEIKEA